MANTRKPKTPEQIAAEKAKKELNEKLNKMWAALSDDKRKELTYEIENNGLNQVLIVPNEEGERASTYVKKATGKGWTKVANFRKERNKPYYKVNGADDLPTSYEVLISAILETDANPAYAPTKPENTPEPEPEEGVVPPAEGDAASTEPVVEPKNYMELLESQIKSKAFYKTTEEEKISAMHDAFDAALTPAEAEAAKIEFDALSDAEKEAFVQNVYAAAVKNIEAEAAKRQDEEIEKLNNMSEDDKKAYESEQETEAHKDNFAYTLDRVLDRDKFEELPVDAQVQYASTLIDNAHGEDSKVKDIYKLSAKDTATVAVRLEQALQRRMQLNQMLNSTEDKPANLTLKQKFVNTFKGSKAGWIVAGIFAVGLVITGATLGAQNSNLSNKNNDLSAQIVDVQNQLEEMQNQLNAANSDLEAAKSEVAAKQAEVTELEEQLQNAISKEDYEKIRVELEGEDGNGGVKKELSDAKGKVEDLQGELDGINAALDNAFTAADLSIASDYIFVDKDGNEVARENLAEGCAIKMGDKPYALSAEGAEHLKGTAVAQEDDVVANSVTRTDFVSGAVAEDFLADSLLARAEKYADLQEYVEQYEKTDEDGNTVTAEFVYYATQQNNKQLEELLKIKEDRYESLNTLYEDAKTKADWYDNIAAGLEKLKESYADDLSDAEAKTIDVTLKVVLESRDNWKNTAEGYEIEINNYKSENETLNKKVDDLTKENADLKFSQANQESSSGTPNIGGTNTNTPVATGSNNGLSNGQSGLKGEDDLPPSSTQVEVKETETKEDDEENLVNQTTASKESNKVVIEGMTFEA